MPGPCTRLTGATLPFIALLAACGADPLDVTAPAFAAARTPATVEATATSTTSIQVSWQPSPNASGYEVHRSTTGASGVFTLLAATDEGVTRHADLGLDPSHEYCYKVRSFRVTGKKTSYSEYSGPACATTPGPVVPPAAPSGTDARPTSSTAVEVSWVDGSTDEAGFRVERSLDEGSTWTAVTTTGPNVIRAGDGARASEQRVCYRVIAFNARGDSPPSPVDCTVPPAAPTDLIARVTDQTAIELVWVDNSAVEDGYEVVRRSEHETAERVVASVPANGTSYRDADVEIETTYWYNVRATRDGGFSTFSSGVSAIIATATPAPPSGALAYATSSSAVIVTWRDESANEEGFRVERSADAGASWEAAGPPTAPSSTWFGDGGRVSEQEVCYRVIAFNAVGDSPASNMACALPIAGPTNLVTVLLDEGIELTWTDNSMFEDGYVIVVTTTCTEQEEYSIADVPANVTRFVHTDWRDWWTSGACSAIGYYVVAWKGMGWSDYSNLAAP